MSLVTNIILSVGVYDDEQIAEVNAYLSKTYEYGNTRPIPLIDIRDPAVSPDGYGGTKSLECRLFIGAYNYFRLDEFLAFLQTIRWSDPTSLQLMVKEQQDRKFRLIDVMNYHPASIEEEDNSHDHAADAP